ncbi:hypothetical protein GCM10023093_02270 [Nemorincola caseinilytica]|uniref:Cation/H+ exchanger transmembrane domain-containing protein n=1 Tax=Nemorincola caseinilytica TaxID=2054315 RepID=A0ABP8N2E8_9BACT
MPIQLHTHTVIILLSSTVILSYLFNMLSRKTQIPSVLLLIATGLGVQLLLNHYGYTAINVQKLVKILGAVGIIMIVLEAAMDLSVNREKLPLIRNSFLSALGIFALSALGIGSLIAWSLDRSLHQSLIYAIPMSIISSAIVIPSTSHLQEAKKEFIIYESSFSDIIGILVFDYMLMENVLSWRSFGIFAGNLVLALIISILASLLLLYILMKITVTLRFFLMFAILALVYSAGEMIHIPSLLIVLVFGLVLNNSKQVLRGPFARYASPERMNEILHLMRSITAETSFLLRTFFFILFGYTIDIASVATADVALIGSLIVAVLFVSRFLYLRFILKANLLPELFLMPRGLVTILLFYSIPASRVMDNFNPGILLFVVILTSLLMMLGLMFFHQREDDIL